jgi:hypothetical protein
MVSAESLPVQTSLDDGATWRALAESDLGEMINGIFESRFDLARLCVATLQKGLFLTEDAGEHWAKCDLPLSDPITSVAESPTAPGVVYAATMKGDVLLSADRGFTFHTIRASDNPETKWSVLIAHPRVKDCLPLGSTFGVMVSWDGGTTWVRLNTDTGFYVNHVATLNEAGSRFLFASTQGLFALDFDALLNTLTAEK